MIIHFNPHWTGEGWNQDGAHSIACRPVYVKARGAKIGVYVVYHLINMWMKKIRECLVKFLKNFRFEKKNLIENEPKF